MSTPESHLTPKPGTDEEVWWRRGAYAEAAARREGMTKEGHELYEAVELMAQRGDGRDDMVEWIAFVFTADWSWRARLRLAWKVATGKV